MKGRFNQLEVNDITSIYGKDSYEGYANWAENIITGDEKKVKAWIQSLPENDRRGVSKSMLSRLQEKLHEVLVAGKDSINNPSMQENGENNSRADGNGGGRVSFMVSEERDADYMDAVEKGDSEKAGRMVREAAKRAGVAVDANGNPIDLYHGTRHFGFTVFDRGRSKLGFFFSTLRSVAGNYGTHDMYAGVRRINKPLKDDGSAESVLHNARSVFSQDWRMATDEEKEAIISKTEAEAKEVAEKLEF